MPYLLMRLTLQYAIWLDLAAHYAPLPAEVRRHYLRADGVPEWFINESGA